MTKFEFKFQKGLKNKNFCERPWIDFKLFQNSGVDWNFLRKWFWIFFGWNSTKLKNFPVKGEGGVKWSNPPILSSGDAPVSEGMLSSAFLYRAFVLFYRAQGECIWQEWVRKTGKPNKAWSILVIFIPSNPRNFPIRE